MRFFVLIPLALAAAIAQQAPPGAAPGAGPQTEAVKTAHLEGAVRSTTGEPVPRAAVRLQGGAATGGLPTVYSTSSDEQGNFVLDNIEPGRNYRLTAQKPGFVNAQFGARTGGPGAPLTLTAGQVWKGLVVEMTPQGVITGQITDNNGDPVVNALVVALRPGYARGVRQYAPGGTAQSNDQGEYRIANLPPGRYYLSASQRTNILGAIQRNAGEDAHESNVTTYFSNAAELRNAAAVNITPGVELRGMDIRLLRAKTYSIGGKVVDAVTGEPAVRVLMTAIRKEDSTSPIVSMLARSVQPTRIDGAFEFGGLTPGVYVVQAMGGNIVINGQPAAPRIVRAEVTLADADITGLVVQASSGATVTGTVRLEGGEIASILPQAPEGAAAAANAPAGIVALPADLLRAATQPSVSLAEASPAPLGSVRPGQIQQDGSFAVEGVGPSQYRVNVSALPQGVYIKSVSLGGQKAVGGVIDLTAGAGGALEIVLSPKAADITGVVRNDDGEAMPGIAVTIWPRAGDAAQGAVRLAISDQNGGFQFRGLPPDAYYVAAWEEGQTGLLTSPDFLAKFSGQAAEVELGESAHQAMEAKLIPAAKIAAEVAKLP